MRSKRGSEAYYRTKIIQEFHLKKNEQVNLHELLKERGYTYREAYFIYSFRSISLKIALSAVSLNKVLRKVGVVFEELANTLKR